MRILDRRLAFVAVFFIASLVIFAVLQPSTVSSLAARLPATPQISIAWPTTAPTESPFAFVFYAMNPGYACGALLLIRHLSILSPGIPSVLMVPPSLPKSILAPFAKYNTTIIPLDPPPLAPGGNTYYNGVLLKLMAFSLRRHLPHLTRIIVLDADQIVLKPLHPLFALPETDVAAPVAYWLDPATYTTSTLIVISLSDRLWSEVLEGMKNIKKEEYDMDLLNSLFYPRRMLVLPGSYCTLNSHWEVQDAPAWQRNKSEGLPGLMDEASVVHFTAGGKPWQVHMPAIRNKPGVHKLFVQMFEDWRKEAAGTCAEGWDTMLNSHWPTPPF